MKVDFARSTPKLIYHLGKSGSVRGVLSNEWVNARSAVGQWQSVPGTLIRFEEGLPVDTVDRIPAEDGRVDILWVDPGSYPMGQDFGGTNTSLTLSNTGQVAVTYLFTDLVSTDVILQAVILVRRDLNYVTSYTQLSANQPFLETILLHELGHVLGANHSPLGTSTLWWYSGGGVNAATGLSADELAFAQSIYGTAATRATLGRIAGTVRLNGTAQLGAMVLLEKTNGIAVSAAVTRANGTYELLGLPAGTYQIRVNPLDPNLGGDATLVRGVDLDVSGAGEYSLANTGFQSNLPATISVAPNTSQTRDFAVMAGTTPYRITEIRQGFNRSDRASADLALQLAPGKVDAWLGVYVPGTISTNTYLRITGDGITYGTTEIIDHALRQLSLIQVPVSIATNATSGPRTFELNLDGKVIRAFGFVEVLPPFPDDNFDGLNDLFQRAYWSPFTQPQSGPELDPDGDGYNNFREAAAGTNPLDNSSFSFQASIRRTPAAFIINASVGVGKSYQLFTQDSVVTGWQPWGVARVAVTGTQEWTDDRPLTLERYYQIRRVR